MIDKIKLILKKWGQSIIEFLIFFPVLFLMGIYIIPHYQLWLWLGFIAAYYLVGIMLGRLFERSRRIISILVGMLISGVGTYFIFDGKGAQIVLWILGIAAFARGVQLRGNRWEDIFPFAGLWIGLAAYFIEYFFFTRVEMLRPFSPVFGWVGIIYMVIVLFYVNFVHLKRASLPGDKEPVIPHTIIKHNRLLITIILIVIGIISFFKALKEGVEWLVGGIGYLLLRFLVLLSELLAPAETQGPSGHEGGGFEGLLPPIEERPPSIWDKIVSIIGIIITIIAVLAFLGLLIYVLYKLFKKIMAWLSRFYQMGKDMEDYGGYVDEKESLMDLKGLGRDYVDRFRRWLTELMEREPRWDDLKTNKEKIRYIYRHFLLHCIAAGYSFKAYLTPREIGKELSQKEPEKAQNIEELTAAYQQVRYGDKDISDEKIKKLFNAFLKDN